MQINENILSHISSITNNSLTDVEMGNGVIIVKDRENNFYELQISDKHSIDVERIYKSIKANVVYPLYHVRYRNSIYSLSLYSPFAGEELAASKKMLSELINNFSKTKIPVSLKKQDIRNLEKIYQILDRKFMYLEMRIREIETKPQKGDSDWIILSKYHIILDAKVKMYDLQQEIFKMIDEGLSLDFGLIHPKPSVVYYKKGLISRYQKSFIGPISILLARFFVENDHLGIYNKEFEEVFSDYSNRFYKTHFYFLVMYIYILRLDVPTIINLGETSKYMSVVSRINRFIKTYLK